MIKTLLRNQFLQAMSKITEDKIQRKIGAMITVNEHIAGSPRYLRKKFENVVAMANKMGRPDLFITFTGSPEWKELKVSQI
jgi:hypothetical protein